jgi:hypothetical protein
MTKTPIGKSKGTLNDQRRPDHTTALLSEAKVNVTVMLQAADFLRELGCCDRLAIALHARSQMTSAVIAKAEAARKVR